VIDALLASDILGGSPIAVTVYTATALFLGYLLFRPRTRYWPLIAAATLIIGGLVGLLVLWLAVDIFDSFGGPVLAATWWWAAGCFSGIALVAANLVGTRRETGRIRWWHWMVAPLSIVVFAIAATLGINDAYGLNRTVANLFHISTAKPIALPTVAQAAGAASAPTLELMQPWRPPASMPKTGSIGTVDIPNTNSKFPARAAQLYLPPAALVPDAPRLPLVIMMMGQPGDPNADVIGAILNDLAASNHGLAPIALVVDQLGNPAVDPLCLDTAMGNVETYLMKDVMPWARATLNIQLTRNTVTVAGYSNGGTCAAYFGAKHPDVFGNIIAISPTEYAGAERSKQVLSDVFKGNQAAYDAVKPTNIMATKAPYTDTVAIYTVGQTDSRYQPGVKHLTDEATKAGMSAKLHLVPHGDHGISALNGGLNYAFQELYPRLGLSG